MIQELLNLNTRQSVSLATQILTGWERTPSPELSDASKAAARLPITWQREWALTVLRCNAESVAVRKIIAKAKRKKLSTRSQAWAVISDCRSQAQTVAGLSLLLLGDPFTIYTILCGDKIMRVDSEKRDDPMLPLQLHLGELTISVEDILALKRGETLRCPLPDTVYGTLHTLGSQVGAAQITFADGKITLTATQLLVAAADNQSSLVLKE